MNNYSLGVDWFPTSFRQKFVADVSIHGLKINAVLREWNEISLILLTRVIMFYFAAPIVGSWCGTCLWAISKPQKTSAQMCWSWWEESWVWTARTSRRWAMPWHCECSSRSSLKWGCAAHQWRNHIVFVHRRCPPLPFFLFPRIRERNISLFWRETLWESCQQVQVYYPTLLEEKKDEEQIVLQHLWILPFLAMELPSGFLACCFFPLLSKLSSSAANWTFHLAQVSLSQVSRKPQNILETPWSS